MIDCMHYTTELKSCDNFPKWLHVDAEYCETLDHTAKPISEYGGFWGVLKGWRREGWGGERGGVGGGEVGGEGVGSGGGERGVGETHMVVWLVFGRLVSRNSTELMPL